MSEQTRHSSEADVLSSLLSQFSPRANVFFSGSFCGSKDYRDEEGGYVHLVRSGSLKVRLASGSWQCVDQPSLVLVPKATSHAIETVPDEDAELVCARLSFADIQLNPILLGFPDLLIVPLAELDASKATLELLFEEAFARRYGYEVTVNRLVEVLIILLLRHCLAKGYVNAGLLGGLSDPKLARSLSAMHAKPDQDWTVERLADTAGMSRANFAATFKLHVGLSPGDYLTMLRVNKAKQALLSGKHLKVVAAQVGYRSPTALARVFHRRVGCNPRDFVRAARA